MRNDGAETGQKVKAYDDFDSEICNFMLSNSKHFGRATQWLKGAAIVQAVLI
ncbi:hypothetical protein BIZ37_16320 [Photobacterium sp. BZF1]|uniref:hypothetical protein n=1 Tax=Photobacterium sp. BZF1 TaxID=1904457 RepID=UPI001653CAB6|nr:hypothetical protein [Photobacterium sp. BZF1]MBC7004129.1 hypothetical protein [Photobacterium sp. BZF1]